LNTTDGPFIADATLNFVRVENGRETSKDTIPFGGHGNAQEAGEETVVNVTIHELKVTTVALHLGDVIQRIPFGKASGCPLLSDKAGNKHGPIGGGEVAIQMDCFGPHIGSSSEMSEFRGDFIGHTANENGLDNGIRGFPVAVSRLVCWGRSGDLSKSILRKLDGLESLDHSSLPQYVAVCGELVRESEQSSCLVDVGFLSQAPVRLGGSCGGLSIFGRRRF
jgi:hypothetical protein